jgi:undecaprenyl-diphosphatase
MSIIMTLFQAFILGIVQGLTEFLPVSSSGHLVLAPYWLGWDIAADQAFVFDVLVQMGTLVAVFIFFWQDVVQITRSAIHGLVQRQPFADPQARMAWYLLLATIPAGIAGLWLKDIVEAAFNSVRGTAIELLITAALLVVAERVGRRDRTVDHINWLDALIIGCFQIIAIFPGVSRSGSTIVGGMIRNLDRPAAARFSFLMSIPIMLAAGLLSTIDLLKMPGLGGFLPQILTGFVTSAIVGYLSIRWLLGYLAKRPLFVFAGYVAIVGVVTLVSLAL